ncbi:MAG: inorganic phosphate transporter [Bacteroidota bacterium]
MFGLDPWLTFLLLACLTSAVIFEFINGFHDTANAVATVIYTHSLKPVVAVMWSGLWNFIGVFVGGIAVAMGIVKLLPTELLLDQNVYHSISMILALVITAIIWNLGTWWLGIPCSSSHTLIGSIFGVGLVFLFMPGNSDVVLNWSKVKDVGLSLFISPMVGFGLALLLMIVAKKFIKNQVIFDQPIENQPPPLWVRAFLILTCTSVSFSHGSNDGQKGVGLTMIILISIVPAYFALDHSQSPQNLIKDVKKIELSIGSIDTSKMSPVGMAYKTVIGTELSEIVNSAGTCAQFSKLPAEKTREIRKSIIMLSKQTDDFYSELNKPNRHDRAISSEKLTELKDGVKHLKKYTEYSPWWVLLMISLSLGLGTMIGWKRIVVTVGEKIGKTHLTYAQGASAELITAITIMASTNFGLPVSTTHVLSSGVAGTMVAGKGLKNLRKKTVRNIAIAWFITLPVTIIMSGGIFLGLWYLIS